jgi:hypothetical protein
MFQQLVELFAIGDYSYCSASIFLGFANDRDTDAHSEEKMSSRTLMSTNLSSSLRYCCSTDLGTVFTRASIG